MKKRLHIGCICFAACLNICVSAHGDTDLPPPSPTAQSAERVPSDREELLMFYEEKDLYVATKRATSLRKAPAIATIITEDEIRSMGARNLLDVLKMVPGFGISINEFNARMIEVRGIRTGTNEKILVMIDGHSLNNNINGSALYRVAGMLPMENIKQVEVVRGPGSALYGNSAFIATINIITRNPEDIDGLEIKGSGGSFNTFKGNLLGGTAIDDTFSIAGSLDHYQTDGPKLTIEADALRSTPYSKAPGTTNLSDRQTDAFLKASFGNLSFRGHYLTKEQGMNIGVVSALTDNTNKTQVDNYWGELAYNLSLADQFSTTLKLSYDYYEQDPNMKIYPDGFRGLFPDGMIGKPLVKDSAYRGELQFDWDIFAGNHLIAGFAYEELRQYDVKQLANFNPLTGAPLGSVQEVANWNKNASRQIFATYLQDEWQLPARINLTGGVRYDHYSDFGDTFNPRLGLVWSFLESADLKLLYGQAFRAPTFQELYNINNLSVVGNSNLKPERISTYEAGLGWRLNRFFAANLNYFYSIITDQIGWVPSTKPGTPAVNSNIGKSETQGIELGLNGAIAPDLHWKLSYTYQDPRDADTGLRLPYVPSHRANSSINYAMTNYLILHTDLLWTGTRPRQQGDSRSEMPAYTTVDLAVTLKNFFETLEIQATVRNLFDQHYKDPDTSGPLQKVPGDFPQEGISAYVSASYRF